MYVFFKELHNECTFLVKFIFYPLLNFEVELLIVIEVYFIIVNRLPTFANHLLSLVQKLLIAGPKSQA